VATNKTKDTPAEAAPEAAFISIDRIEAVTIRVPIIGTSPLIVHRFAEKAKRQMLDAMTGRKTLKEPKDPVADYEGAFYLTTAEEYGFPATAFKQATVGGARFYGSSVTMTALRQSIFFGGVPGDGMSLTPIDGEPQMREDVVRVNRGGTDLRYRPEFQQWSAVLTVTYVKAMLTKNSLLSLIDAGGMGVGVGEWRPEKGGDFGTFRIDPDRAIEVL
jgi:hypothetical protein